MFMYVCMFVSVYSNVSVNVNWISQACLDLDSFALTHVNRHTAIT